MQRKLPTSWQEGNKEKGRKEKERKETREELYHVAGYSILT